MTSNDMPDETVIFRNSNGGLEFGPAPEACDWLINTKYIRADLCAAPAVNAEALEDAIAILSRFVRAADEAEKILRPKTQDDFEDQVPW